MPATAPPTRASSVDRILASGLFGSPDASAPRTSLPFTLKGTYAGPHGQGFAIIADSHGKNVVYANGGHLPGDVRISAIEAHQVLLDTPDGKQSLPLHEAAAAPSLRAAPNAPHGPGPAGGPGFSARTERDRPRSHHALSRQRSL